MYMDRDHTALALYVAVHRMRLTQQVPMAACTTAMGRWLAMSTMPANQCIGHVMEPLLRAWRR